MPLEGHWERVNTPLRRLTRRERNVAIVSAVLPLLSNLLAGRTRCVGIVTVLALVLATVGDSRPGPKPGCIYAIVPGVMGATPIEGCRAQARKICAEHASLSLRDPVSRGVRTSCRRAGLL
jgi:hypothetical protein